MTETIFVFGSNLAGRHGKGAALEAREKWGAKYGVPVGRTGNAYAIPTKDGRGGASLSDPAQTLPLVAIRTFVERFLDYARANPDLTFMVTPIGTGLAGYSYEEIAPLFRRAPSNCKFVKGFELAMKR